MRKYQLPPALVPHPAVRTAPFREVQVPLFLELPRRIGFDEPARPAPTGGHLPQSWGVTIDPDEDDDFY